MADKLTHMLHVETKDKLRQVWFGLDDDADNIEFIVAKGVADLDYIYVAFVYDSATDTLCREGFLAPVSDRFKKTILLTHDFFLQNDRWLAERCYTKRYVNASWKDMDMVALYGSNALHLNFANDYDTYADETNRSIHIGEILSHDKVRS